MLSRLLSLLLLTPLFAIASTLWSGTVTIPGTFSFDFDARMLVDLFDPSADVFMHELSATESILSPEHGAQIVNLGGIDFASLTEAGLRALTYGGTPLDSGLFVPGDVFAVKTNGGNYVKAQVIKYTHEYRLDIRAETYGNVPEPCFLLLWPAIAGLALVRRAYRGNWRTRSRQTDPQA